MHFTGNTLLKKYLPSRKKQNRSADLQSNFEKQTHMLHSILNLVKQKSIGSSHIQDRKISLDN